MDAVTQRDATIVPWTDPPAPRARLVCLGHAAAGAARFRAWRSSVPADVALWALRIPGRETRLLEEPLERIEDVADLVHDALAPEADVPMVLMGHCSGAIVMLEVARRLAATRPGQPARLVVAGQAPPAVVSSEPLTIPASATDVADYLRGIGGTPEELLGDAEFLDLIAPAVRADVAVLADFEDDGAPVSCPISCFVGDHDRLVGAEDMEGWQAASSEPLEIAALPGDHLLTESWDELGAAIADLVSREAR